MNLTVDLSVSVTILLLSFSPTVIYSPPLAGATSLMVIFRFVFSPHVLFVVCRLFVTRLY